MKTVLSSDYKYKKIIADNLQDILDRRYIEISDDEYERVNNAIATYNTEAQSIYDNLYDVFVQDHSELISKVEQLEDDVEDLKGNSDVLDEIEQLEEDIAKLQQNEFEVEENGIYFVDEEGYIAVKINQAGLHAINIDESGTSGGSSVSMLANLSDVDISNPTNGQSLLYYSNTNKWKNGVAETGGSNTISIVNY